MASGKIKAMPPQLIFKNKEHSMLRVLLLLLLFSLHSHSSELDGLGGPPFSVATLWQYPSLVERTVFIDVDWPGETYPLPRYTASEGGPYAIAFNCIHNGGAKVTYKVRGFSVIAYPKRLHIVDSHYAKIDVAAWDRTVSLPNWNMGMGLISDWFYYADLRCPAIGDAHAGTYPLIGHGEVDATITIPPALPAGNYSVNLPVKAGYYSSWYNAQPIATISDSAILDIIRQENTLLNIVVKNSCKYSHPGTLSLQNRSLDIAKTNSNTKSLKVAVQCNGDTRIKLDIDTLYDNVSGGFRVGLSKSWNSKITINGQPDSVADSLLSNKSKSYNIESELLQHSTLKDGGSIVAAILNIQIL